MNPRNLPVFLLVATLVATFPALAVDRNMKDNFQDGTTQGWIEGVPSPNEPVNVASGGPSGSVDSYLRNVSTGGGGSGSAMVMFNTSTWTGDWIATEVTSISAHMANFGATDLHMRIAIEGDDTTRWGSTDAVMLPADGQWYEVSFQLSVGMSPISGTATLGQVLGSVNAFRILSAQTGPSWQGDRIAGDLGVDNLRANPEVETDVTLNGLDGPLLITAGDSVSIGVKVEISGIGVPADWFLIAQSAFGFFHYDLNFDSFVPGIAPTFQGSLFNATKEFGPFELPPGTYTIFFGVDTLANGAPDVNLLSLDSVEVMVVP